jgi:hypothetical protein
MLKVQIRQSLLAAGALAVLFTALLALQSSSAIAKDGVRGVEGALVSVNAAAGTLNIRVRRSQTVEIATNPTTKIERNDRRATLAAFKLGDRVEAKFLTTAGSVAFKVEAVGP